MNNLQQLQQLVDRAGIDVDKLKSLSDEEQVKVIGALMMRDFFLDRAATLARRHMQTPLLKRNRR
jgi:hypothetical protein